MTGVTPVKQLNSSATTAIAATAALTDDSAFCFTVTTGRPALGPYLASIVQHTSAAAATGRQATGTAAAAVAPIDVYVSGPEALQQGARLSYDRRIKPAVRGSSFLPLSYTIG
jgi:cytochrome c2